MTHELERVRQTLVNLYKHIGVTFSLRLIAFRRNNYIIWANNRNRNRCQWAHHIFFFQFCDAFARRQRMRIWTWFIADIMNKINSMHALINCIGSVSDGRVSAIQSILKFSASNIKIGFYLTMHFKHIYIMASIKRTIKGTLLRILWCSFNVQLNEAIGEKKNRLRSTGPCMQRNAKRLCEHNNNENRSRVAN